MISNADVTAPSPSQAHEDAVRRALASLWAADLVPTHRAVCKESKSLGTPIHAATVTACLEKWTSDGLAELQIGPSGFRIPRRLDFTGKSRQDADAICLADVITLFLAAPESEVPAHQKRALRSAVRAWFDLPDQCPEQMILKAAEGVTAEAFQRLPSQIAEKVRNRGSLSASQSKVASNYQSVVRAALRHAASRHLIPLFFPQTGGSTNWLGYRDLIFGTPDRALTQPELSQRYHWGCLARFGERLLPGLDPSNYTMTQLHEVLEEMVRAGKGHARPFAVWGMRILGKDHGMGPYAAFFAKHGGSLSRNGRINAGYLLAKDGSSASDGNIDKLIEVVLDNGYGPEWAEFLRWYHEYSTLDDQAIERDPLRFPDRLQKRHLSQSTWVKRAEGIRAWLHQAPRGTGLPPANLTPEAVYGQHARQILVALLDWWKDRADAGEVSNAASDGLVALVKGGGMIALALYERSIHSRGLRCEFSGPFGSLTPTAALAAASAQEHLLIKTYQHARTLLDRFDKARAGTATGGMKTTLKNLRRIVKNTPHTYWITILDAMHAEIQKRLATESCRDKKTHRLIRDALVLGLLISTGCRRGELCHIRLDVHFTSAHRLANAIELRGVDRKNKSPHVAAIHARYVPAWLLDEYLGRTRPWFMATHRLELGKTPVQHKHLLVMNSGDAFGCSEERMDGSGRNHKAFEVRKSRLGIAWKLQMQVWAAKLKLPVPTNHGEGSMHVVRNAMAAAIALSKGFEAAAHYLGDDVGTVRETYGFLDGTSIDATDLPGVTESILELANKMAVPRQDSRPTSCRKSQAPAAAISSLPLAALRRKIADLTEALAVGEIDSAGYQAQVSRLELAMGGLSASGGTL